MVRSTIVWNIIQIQHGTEELWHGHRCCVCVRCTLGVGNMTMGEEHETPLGHGQQLCEILSRSHMAVRNYGPHSDFDSMCTWTFSLEKYKCNLGPRVKVRGLLNIRFSIMLSNPVSWLLYTWVFIMNKYCLNQEMCVILYRSNMTAGSYDTDTNFGYVCTLTLTFDINCMTLGKGHDSPFGYGQQMS